MKPDWRRIESSLNKLAEKNSPDFSEPTMPIIQGIPRLSSSTLNHWGAKKQPKTNPCLPKLKSSNVFSHHHTPNPALAINLLQDIAQVVHRWQKELKELKQKIEAIYLAGPIIDGWLESYPRKGQTENCLDSVQDLISPEDKLADCSRYRLCGLHEDGKLWYRACPAEQVADVSIAIARYQKLKQLLNRKQDLEYRLEQLAVDLASLCSSLTNKD